MSRSAIRALGAYAVVVGLLALLPAAALAAGNGENAKRCQKGGWQQLYTSSGQAFKNEGACTSYAAKGGTLSTSSTPQNRAPTAVLEIGSTETSQNPLNPCGGFTTNDVIGFASFYCFRGTNSSDPDGNITSWTLDFGDGSPVSEGSWPMPNQTHVYAQSAASAAYSVTLTITDAGGLTSSDSSEITVVSVTG
jgi:hypothetical protein